MTLADTVDSAVQNGVVDSPNTAATHDVIAERLKMMKDGEKTDVSKMQRCRLDLLGLDVYAGPMGYKHHKAWMDIKRHEDLMHERANKTEEDPQDRTLSDRYLLAHAVFSADGKPLGEELAGGLMDLRDGGSQLYQLLSAAEAANPPREYMAVDVARLLSKSALDCLIWRVLFEAGLGKALIDYLSANATEDEKAWAIEQLRKVEEVAFALQPLFEAEEAAKLCGITFNQGMTLVAQYGKVEDVVEQMQAPTEVFEKDEE